MTQLRALVATCLAVLTSAMAPIARGQDLVRVQLLSSKATVSPGDHFALAVIFEMEPGYHLHTDRPELPPGLEFDPIPTVVEWAGGGEVRAWPTQYPAPHVTKVRGSGGLVDYKVFDGRVAIYVPVELDESFVGGQLDAKVRVGYQACDDSECLMPEDVVLQIAVPVVPLSQRSASEAPASSDFSGFDTSVFATERGEPSRAVQFEFFGRRFSVDPSGAGLVALLLLAALGGFILNVTPCVLPVIPIKIMGISSIAAHPGRCLMLGSVMSAGVVAFWLGIGLAISLLSNFNAANQLFQMPAFTIGVGVFIFVMGFGMLGLFTTGLPRWVYAINPRHDTLHGSFLFGIITAVLATPCTAPFMGAAMAWATQQPPWLTLLTFGSIGIGMALPYVVLSANPKWVSRIPRTGPASSLVKQVMGLFLLGVAGFFLGTGVDPLLRSPVDPAIREHWYAVAALIVAACAWAGFRTIAITKRAIPRVVVGVLGLVVSVGIVAFAVEQNDRGPVNWVYYTPDRFEEAIARRDVVVVDFTAEWCANCKALEGGVLHRAEVSRLLNAEGVTAIKVDLTGGYPEGAAFLRELDWAGIPLLAIFGPGVSEPFKFDSYTPASVLAAIEQARGN